MRLVGFTLTLAFVIAAFGSPAFAEKRVALIIGNGTYQSVAALANPVRDASAMANLFRKAGFDHVRLETDVGANALRRALHDFADVAADADIAVVFYAGHGVEVGGKNYLVPIDAALASDYDIEDETVALDRVLQALDPVKRLKLVILDACRENPFAARMRRTSASRAIGRGLAPPPEPQGGATVVAYAARAGSLAADGTGPNSPFTSALLHHLVTPGLDVRLALGQVRDDVLKSTGNRQEPFLYGSLGGTIVALAPPMKGEGTPNHIELNEEVARAYDAASTVGTKEAWDAFLATYSHGFYADLARARRARIQEALLGPTQSLEPTKRPIDAPQCLDAPDVDCLNQVLRETASSSINIDQCTRFQTVLHGKAWKDIWTTSVYSFAPGGGGPGGGLANDELKVGGWGDLYYSYISFDVDELSRSARKAILFVYNKQASGAPVAMKLEIVRRPWGWKEGDRLWWRDRPSSALLQFLQNVPRIESWYAVDVTDAYRQWKKGDAPNYGILLSPVSNNNEFNVFASSRVSNQDLRPRLVVCE